MLSIKECRNLLGEKYSDCSDEEILSIRDWLTELAKINKEVVAHDKISQRIILRPDNAQ